MGATKIQTRCPKCSSVFRTTADMVGEIQDCPACEQLVVVGKALRPKGRDLRWWVFTAIAYGLMGLLVLVLIWVTVELASGTYPAPATETEEAYTRLLEREVGSGWTVTEAWVGRDAGEPRTGSYYRVREGARVYKVGVVHRLRREWEVDVEEGATRVAFIFGPRGETVYATDHPLAVVLKPIALQAFRYHARVFPH